DRVVYVNRNYITVVNRTTFISARPVNRFLVRDAAILREARAARLTEALPIPADSGARPGFTPPANVVNRAAVVRTAPPAPPRAFQEKLAEIQKNQGKAVAPARLAAAAKREGAERPRFRPAA